MIHLSDWIHINSAVERQLIFTYRIECYFGKIAVARFGRLHFVEHRISGKVSTQIRQIGAVGGSAPSHIETLLIDLPSSSNLILIVQSEMMLSFAQSICLLLAAVSSAQAQLSYLSKPNATWTVQASELAAGNGLFLDPTGSMIVATFLDGSVRFLDPATGSAVAPQYTPTSNGFSVRGFGGAAFSYNSATPYIVYAVTDNYLSATSADT